MKEIMYGKHESFLKKRRILEAARLREEFDVAPFRDLSRYCKEGRRGMGGKGVRGREKS